jgi:hypothetical protein
MRHNTKLPVDTRRCPDFFSGDQITRSARSRINRRAGEEAQDIVERFMRDCGFHCVERIETGFGVVRRGKKLIGAYAKRRVSGDIKAIAKGGIAVHVEVKYRPRKPDGRLVLQISDFETHQLDALQSVTEARGAAFVAWVVSLYPAQLFWLKWPFPLAHRKALTAEQAAQIHYVNINEV